VTTLTTWDKTGYALSATGLDLVAKTATGALALADAVWEEATRTITGGTITTYTGNTPQTADNNTILSSATHGNAALRTLLLDVPTVAEFEARSLVAASYFDPALDTVATVTTLTGHTPQTGDSFALIGATGSGLTSLAPAATALSSATWTATRAGYLDKLNVTGALANTDNAASFKATGFSTHSAAGVVTALKASTGWTVGGTATFATIQKINYAMLRGKFTLVGTTFTLYDDDNTTSLGTWTVGNTGRTPD